MGKLLSPAVLDPVVLVSPSLVSFTQTKFQRDSGRTDRWITLDIGAVWSPSWTAASASGVDPVRCYVDTQGDSHESRAQIISGSVAGSRDLCGT
jgi:hypothetical protein